MRRVGLVPEQDAVYDNIGIWDVVTYLTRLQGFTKVEARDRARRALERVGLGNYLDRSAAGFSKGQKQRAKLAQALAHEPDVLILDEPLNGLDPTGRREYAELIRTLGAEGHCLVVSSHILHEVEAVSREVLVLRDGRVLAEGTARQIREDLSDHPLTVHIRTPHGAQLATRIVQLDGIRRVQIDGENVEVRTRAPNDLFDAVASIAASGDIRIDAMIPVDEDLESVFRYLTQ